MSILNIVFSFIVGASISTVDTPTVAATTTSIAPDTVSVATTTDSSVDIPDVPFYSQFYDISSPYWQKRGCGIASLAMMIDFYTDQSVSVDNLLNQGRDSGAYIYGAGWAHQGLVNLSERYGLGGRTYDLSGLSNKTAFERFKKIVENGPAIVSVHYTFDPQNPIPHLAVINGVEDDTVYYNDPAGKSTGGEISVSGFLEAWKQRFIVIRPS